jgi:3'(2'), 5'-bisphosphate nucleotidase
MIDIDRPEIKFALNAVRQASLLAKMVQAEMITPALTKDDRSPVTVADFASQALVAYLLEREFPGDALVAEEDASGLRVTLAGNAAQTFSTLEQVTRFSGRFIPGADPGLVCDWIDRGAAKPSARFWTLDPIDGTKGFLRGDQYAVALALVVDGQVELGVLGCPNLVILGSEGGVRLKPDINGAGRLVLAARGEGTWIALLAQPERFERVQASQRVDPAQARLLRSYESGHTNIDQLDDFAQALGIQAASVRMDSQAKYAVLAAGEGDLLLRLLSPTKPDYREKIWDQAAGSLVVQEAGGIITDLDGKPLDFTAGRTLLNNRGILASNSLLHPAALQALRAVGA